MRYGALKCPCVAVRGRACPCVRARECPCMPVRGRAWPCVPVRACPCVPIHARACPRAPVLACQSVSVYVIVADMTGKRFTEIKRYRTVLEFIANMFCSCNL